MKKKMIDKLFSGKVDTGGSTMPEPKTKIKLIPGEKNLYIDKNGAYHVRFFHNGRVFPKKLLATGKTAARFEKDAYILDVKNEAVGIINKSKIPAILKAIDLWKEGRKGEVTEGYLEKGSHVLKIILNKIGHIRIDNVTTPLLKEVIMSYHNTTYIRSGKVCKHSPNVTNSIIILVKSLFTYFVDQEILKTNVAKKLNALQVPEQAKNVISDTNYDAFFKEIDAYNSFFLSFQARAMFFLGLRISEAIKMKWASYNDVTKTYTPGRMSITKGKEATELKIPACFLPWIEKASKQEDKSLIYMVVNPKTQLPYHPSSISERFQEVSEKLGIKYIPHCLRASYITLASQKHDMPTVQKLARHVSVNTTMKYIQVSQDRMNDAVEDTFKNFAG